MIIWCRYELYKELLYYSPVWSLEYLSSEQLLTLLSVQWVGETRSKCARHFINVNYSQFTVVFWPSASSVTVPGVLCAASTAEEEEGRRRYDDRMRVMQESQEQDSQGLSLNDDHLDQRRDIFKYLTMTIIFSCIDNSELPSIDR